MRKTTALATLAALMTLANTAHATTTAYTLSCPGTVTTDAAGAPDCTNGSGTAVAWQAVPPFSVSELDYGEAGQAFAAGFVIVGMCWALGQAIGAIIKPVKR